MAEAKKISANWPEFRARNFSDIEQAYQIIYDLILSLENFRENLAESINDHGDRLSIEEDSGVPSSTPTKVGLHYLNTSAKDMYISVGTSSSADWKKITP